MGTDTKVMLELNASPFNVADHLIQVLLKIASQSVFIYRITFDGQNGILLYGSIMIYYCTYCWEFGLKLTSVTKCLQAFLIIYIE